MRSGNVAAATSVNTTEQSSRAGPRQSVHQTSLWNHSREAAVGRWTSSRRPFFRVATRILTSDSGLAIGGDISLYNMHGAADTSIDRLIAMWCRESVDVSTAPDRSTTCCTTQWGTGACAGANVRSEAATFTRPGPARPGCRNRNSEDVRFVCLSRGVPTTVTSRRLGY